MNKIAIIISCLFFFTLHLQGQENDRKINFIYEVDSLFNHIKSLENDQVILYYPNGAIKYGIILWTTKKNTSGLVFKKFKDSFLVKKISKKSITQSAILDQFIDSFENFKKHVPTTTYNISHDFNVVWIYLKKMKSHTVIRSMSEIMGGGDSLGRTFFLKFEKLFDLSTSSWRE